MAILQLSAAVGRNRQSGVFTKLGKIRGPKASSTMDINMNQGETVPELSPKHTSDNEEVESNSSSSGNNKLAMITAPMGFVNLNNFEDPIIHNIVATANFCCKFDLSKINIRVRNSEYNPKRFRAVIMRLFDPRTTAMVFSSGKIVCTGAKSERLACLAARKYQRIIQKLGYDVSVEWHVVYW